MEKAPRAAIVIFPVVVMFMFFYKKVAGIIVSALRLANFTVSVICFI